MFVKVALYFGNVQNNLSSIVFYITKIALVLWLAERHYFTRVCKHSCDLKIFCCEGQFYLFYPFPWLLRIGKYLQTCWIKVFFSKLAFKAGKIHMVWNWNRLDYGVPHLATLAVRSLIKNISGNQYTINGSFYKSNAC